MDDTAWKAGPMLRRRLVPADDDDLADIRVQFLSAERFDDDRVRDPILASWWRSRELKVPADRIDLPYIDSRDYETPLIRSARPVLRRLGEQLDGQPISIILTDPTGVVLLQDTGDTDLHRKLERVDLVPGFSYGEKFVGTNGIGTALAENQPVHVFGHEHYAENLENLACAGVPVRHPVSGKTIGAIDLTCWRKDAGRLLMALARSTADQIRQALLNYGDARELALFRAYLAACRRTMGMVMAFDEEAVVVNDRARQLLDPVDQSAIIGQGTTALREGRRDTTVTLATGTKVAVRCRPIAGRDAHGVTGGVLIVDFLDSEQDVAELGGPVLPMFLPGTVGSASTWLRCCHQVDTAYGRGEWSILAGEAGVGKHAIARGVHQRRNPLARMHVLDMASIRPDRMREHLRHELVDDPVGTLVIRHAHRLGADAMTEVADELRNVVENRTGRLPWVALTAEASAELPDDLRALFPLTIEVPPLRRHIEDLPEIVPLMLNRLCPGAPLTCSPAAMHLLSRASWPGNVAQLYLVLKQVTQHRRAGTIMPADLPAEFRTAPRRPLNRIESVERDAIVRGLEDAGGNKVRAAKLLGMSRATIYRKIHNYGIVVPAR
ncbi:sigma-54-dependent Fis family transcriptional regulator [Labedaea rhizosphaerae]|uniref:Transcriptional regulator of acetoin/glycerol metabolism n=1 Tax=Labedaea rhizosphaerae TaxID=598644 RepID=A0A4R6S689_LABRH|nr:transcriptional regulator of acetoin/glycerol metabolism [Labedaea rhizosphaerae]